MFSSVSKIGSKAWMLSGGIFGAGLAVASEVVLPGQTGCGTVAQSYMNTDAECRPVYEINSNVLRFLDLDRETQSRVLASDTNVCDFYKKLHAKAFAQKSFASLECTANGFTAVAKDPGFNDIRYKVKQDPNGTVKSVEVYAGRESKSNATFLTDETGAVTRSNPYPPRTVAQLNEIKLFLPEMQECCKSPSPGCQKDFNLKVAAENRSAPSETPSKPAR